MTANVGFYSFAGFPDSGKTWKAYERAKERVQATGATLLVIQREKDDKAFRDLTAAADLEETCRRVWERGEHTKFRARTPEEVNQLSGVALDEAPRAGGTVVLIDGIWDCLKAPNVQPNVDEIVRSGRHYKIDCLGTSQLVRDFALVARSCALEHYQFLETDDDALKELKKRFGFEPEEVRSLPRHEYLIWTRAAVWRANARKKMATKRKKSPDPPPAPPPPKSRA